MIEIKRPTSRSPLRRALFAGALLMLALQPFAVLAQEGPQPKLPTVEIGAGMHRIHAEVARSSTQQMVGMMGRTQMASHEGMIFVNERADTRCFWMRNTLLPLSIAFIADDGTIVNIAEMQPRSDQSHCSTKPVRFALEMNEGWFSKRGLKAGSKLTSVLFDR
jgi:uncharacterized protein